MASPSYPFSESPARLRSRRTQCPRLPWGVSKCRFGGLRRRLRAGL